MTSFHLLYLKKLQKACKTNVIL